MSASKVLVACWLGLAVLSISTVVLGNAGATLALAGGVLLAAFGKAWLITDGFMELRHAPWPWPAAARLAAGHRRRCAADSALTDGLARPRRAPRPRDFYCFRSRPGLSHSVILLLNQGAASTARPL